MLQLLDKAKNFVAEKIANVSKPEATLFDVDLAGVHHDRVDYTAKISINNLYGRALPICEVSYTLKSDGRVIAQGKMANPGSLKASGTTELALQVGVPHDIVVSLVKDVTRDWDIDYELLVALTIVLPIIGNFTIPLHTKGEIKLPTLSDFF